MSLMFFLSGVFVPGSLSRKGSWSFLSDRLLRIGLPLVVVVVVVMPIAYYPAYVVTAADPSVAAFWQHWSALPFWPCGPQWFLCQLLALNALAAVLHRYAPDLTARLGQLASTARARPVRFFAGLVAVSAVVYVPLALIYTPWAWVNTRAVLVPDQPAAALSRLFLRGLCGRRLWPRARGPLGRRPASAALGRMARGGVRRVRPVGSADLAHARRPRGAAGRACRGGAGIHHRLRRRLLRFLAICLRFATPASLGARQPLGQAYSMYLNHYVFMVWLQFAVLDLALFAVGKAAIVFCGTFVLSWAWPWRPVAFLSALSSLKRNEPPELRPKAAGRGQTGRFGLSRPHCRLRNGQQGDGLVTYAADLHTRVPEPVSRPPAA